jgi:hypothetical protein
MNNFGQRAIYIGDTIRFVSCSTRALSYTWFFGDGTSTTTTDTVVYHVYKGYTIASNITVQLNATNKGGTDSSFIGLDLEYPLANFTCNTCWSGNGYFFRSNSDSTILCSTIFSILEDSIFARCTLTNTRTFSIPSQTRTSKAGLPYTISGQGNVTTDPDNCFFTTLDISVYLNYNNGYVSYCHDTVPL